MDAITWAVSVAGPAWIESEDKIVFGGLGDVVRHTRLPALEMESP